MRRWLEKPGPIKVLLAWLLLPAAWEGAWRIADWKPWLFPAPSHVADSLFSMVGVPMHLSEPIRGGWPLHTAEPTGPRRAVLPGAVLISLTRLVGGFGFSLALGTLLGLLMWRYAFVDALLGPAFLGLQTLPSVCWVPLAVLLLGLNEASILFVLVMGSFFAIAIAMRDGLRQIPPIYTRAALMLGARRWKLYRFVLLPAGLPALAASLRQGFSFAWRSLMGGELIFMLQRRGLGFLLNAGREFADIAQVVAVMAVMVLIGALADRLVFARIERRVRTRFGLD